MEQLCPQDRAILNSLFNPLLPIGEGVSGDTQEDTNTVLNGDTLDSYPPEIHKLNQEAVEDTDKGHFQDALTKFADIIEKHPEWAAPYNNRAQLYRLMRKEEEAVSDLEKAISLTGGSGKVGCQALLQLGLIYRLKGEEDLAREQFQKAAAHGSSFAKKQLVVLNPMAALCNKMLVRMMEDLRQPGSAQDQ